MPCMVNRRNGSRTVAVTVTNDKNLVNDSTYGPFSHAFRLTENYFAGYDGNKEEILQFMG